MKSNNYITEIGGTISSNSAFIVFGNLDINVLTINTSGTTESRILSSKFRASTDNLVWSEWEQLTLSNVQKLNGNMMETLWFEFLFERIGTDTTGVIEILNLELSGNIELKQIDYTDTMKSIFKGVFDNDLLTSAISSNLLKKVFEKGILPNYIERGQGIDNEDFISFWSAVTTFFSYTVSLADKFDSIFNESEFLAEYLNQWGIELDVDNMLLCEMQNIANNYLEQVRIRGTKIPFLKKGDKLLDGTEMLYDGELLRLVSHIKNDEFIYEFPKAQDSGFHVGRHFHLYNGNSRSVQVNKGYENTEDVIDIDKYKMMNSSAEYFSITPQKTLLITPNESLMPIYGGFGLGIAQNEQKDDIPDFGLINVNVNMDYEFTFKIKRNPSADTELSTARLKVGLIGFNGMNYSVEDCFQSYLVSSDDPIYSDTFVDKGLYEILKTNEWYYLRFIMHSIDSQQQTLGVSENNFGFDRLRFQTESVSKVIPNVELLSTDSNDFIEISDVKFRPLIKGKNALPLRTPVVHNQFHSFYPDPHYNNPCFVQNNNNVIVWIVNNGDNTLQYIRNYIDKFLLPYEKKVAVINVN